MTTDAYRAYAHYLETRRRKVYEDSPSARRLIRGRPSAEYGSTLFKERAQKWWISRALTDMRVNGTARREGPIGQSRWFVGSRPPQITLEGKHRYYAPLDVEAQRADHQGDTRAHVRREQVKAQLLGYLNGPKIPAAAARSPMLKEAVELIRLAYEHISGR